MLSSLDIVIVFGHALLGIFHICHQWVVGVEVYSYWASPQAHTCVYAFQKESSCVYMCEYACARLPWSKKDCYSD